MLSDRIRNWQEVGSYCWRHSELKTQFIRIEVYEDCEKHAEDEACDCHEIWVGDDETGNWEFENICESFEEALKEAKQFMKENPDGWLVKTKKKIPFIFR